jgi:transposase, IS30 family
LRTGRVLRMPRARVRRRGKGFVSPEIMISERPAEAADRAVPGHWEGDLILGLGSSAIGTLVERTTRFTMLLHLPRLAGHGEAPRVKNGPALAGHGAEAVRDAITRTVITLPEELRRSLTWDQGAEMAQHDRLKIDAGIQVYFCDPQSPWQRGTNENTNRLLRQYFPKGTDLSIHSAEEISAVAAALNARPRKTLGWKTPAEALDDLLSWVKQLALRRPFESAQYASRAYRDALTGAGITASMSRKADCYDNAPMESFFHTLKTELVHHRDYNTRAEAQRDIFAFIEASTTEPGSIPPSDISLRSKWS